MTSPYRVARHCADYRPSKKLLLAACLVSFALAVPVGFLSGGWVTGGRARMLTALAAENARVELAATICAGRFMAAPDADARLDALRGQAPWYRSIVLENGGWTALAGMPDLPGRQEPVAGSADRCADRLMALQRPSLHVGAEASAAPRRVHG